MDVSLYDFTVQRLETLADHDTNDVFVFVGTFLDIKMNTSDVSCNLKDNVVGWYQQNTARY